MSALCGCGDPFCSGCEEAARESGDLGPTYLNKPVLVPESPPCETFAPRLRVIDREEGDDDSADSRRVRQEADYDRWAESGPEGFR